MQTAILFSSKSDDWATPQDLFDALDAEFQFDIDAAASKENAKCPVWYGGLIDALALKQWSTEPSTIWLNCPYSLCRQFIAKAAQEARRGSTVVCLVPSRTDTRWFHSEVYDAERRQYRPGVEVRFVKGRLKFVGAAAGAPFPSMVVIFRPPEA